MVDIGISGGATKLGAAVLDRLAQQVGLGRVVALRLRGELLAVKAPAGATLVEADVDRDDLTAALKGVQVVIDLAQGPCPGPVVPAGDSPSSTRLQSLRRVLAAAGAAEVFQLVHLSSSVVYGAWPTNPVPLPDDHPVRPDPDFAWALEHTEAERLVADWDDTHPAAKVCVLRPALVLAAGDEGMAPAIGGVRSMRVQGQRRPVQFLHLDDLADAVVLAVRRELEGVFNVAPEGSVDDALASELVSGVKVPSLPEPVVNSLRQALWTAGLGATPPWGGRYVSEPWVISADKLRAQGWQAHYDSEEALVATTRPLPIVGLSPQRRQELLLGGVAAAGLAAAGVAAVAVGWVVRRALRNS